MNLVQVLLSKLRLDGRCQARALFDPEHAAEIGEYLLAGGQVPPVVVFRDRQGTNWVADGNHRIEGHRLAGRKYIEADVRAGELRDAILCAAGANKKHGLKRTNADRRRAALLLLTDPEWAGWSGRKIAEHCGVSESLVRTLREQLQQSGALETQPAMAVERLASYRRTRPPRALSPEKQRAAVEAETARHRPAWLSEARAGLESARRALVCLGDRPEALTHTQAALDSLA